MKTTWFIGLFLVAMIGLQSCGSDTKEAAENPASTAEDEVAEETTIFNNVIGDTLAHFRGFTIGTTTKETVKQALINPIGLNNEAKNALADAFPLVKNQTVNCEIQYQFENEKLFDIQTRIYPKEMDQADALFKRFKTHFDGKFGESRFDSGYTTWTTRNEDQTEVEISLIDESKDDYAMVSISFFLRSNY
jgi:hypothetical protein